jgi:hypothetical protein
MTGRLVGNDLTGCITLLLSDRTEVALFWPPGYRANFHPLQVLDDRGRVVATDQGPVFLGGSHLAEHEHPACHGYEFAFLVTEASMENRVNPR